MDTHENSAKEPVNFIHQFLLAVDKIQEEDGLNPTHVSLFLGLFIMWNLNHFKNPISINRAQMLRVSKIGSKHTYLKCLKDLERLGFIEYHPSKNPVRGSLIYMCNFGTSSDPSTAPLSQNKRCKSGHSSEPSSRQVLHPSLNNTNYTNIKNNIYDEKEKFKKKKKGKTKSSTNSRASAPVSDTGKNASPKGSRFTPPSKKELKAFFEQQTEKYSIPVRFAPVEAEKFFNYYSAKGWKVGSKSPMIDWKAAVRNWLLNFKKFNGIEDKKNEAGKLHNQEDKSYDIPL
ncbi:transcriptional regulator [Marivirga tractuosa]|uniref:Uncharacterized protein n=1 Tax=Marivirga tractuosa (strain ATCC 23168 / DSM 4126 / NBRC 15989 / NCIMB 1408 / VKM B-1430 / H-43) TaxID=643867 RepID=E4TNI2_MARTH|nr:hypothetical protein [Marivirga tractuosa]ADR20439.1 hypothetical protein Ftrac_0433 [Marivirga tractuosa DSM 4126]BDD15116.1 transcriptional regulator [Marivirga tractuosa]